MARFQPQRASFPLHEDNFQYSPDVRVQPGVLASLKEEGRYPEEEMAPYLVAVAHGNSLYRKKQATFNDPIAIFYVLDAILKTPRGHYIRPRYLIPYLRDNHRQYYWSEVSIGRIVAGIHGTCREVYEEHIEMDTGTDEKFLPFASGRDSKGRYYVVDPKGGSEGILWLTAFRSNAHKQSRLLMTAEASGDFEAEGILGHSVVGWDYMLEFAPTAIRSVSAYHAQTHPNDRFSHVAYEPGGRDEPTFA